MRHFFPRVLVTFAAVCLAANAAASTRFVDLNSTNPVAPYSSWETAATNIQDATSISSVGDTVWVTNGVYQYGGDSSANGSNRVDVLVGVTVQSVNGPAVTTIKGYQVPGTTNGASAMRAVYLRQSSKLYGFTVTGGATANSGSSPLINGGGILTDTGCVISNCVITGNAALGNGGGAYLGINTLLLNSVLSSNLAFNSSSGGGAYSFGGGALRAALVNCVVSNNIAYNGCGFGNCQAYNCLIVGNGVTNFVTVIAGSAVYSSFLNNCTVAGNFSHSLGSVEGGSANNSIIYYNSNNTYADCYQCQLTNCCTTIGTGNTTLVRNSFSNAPGFLNLSARDFHLNPWSRCIDAGNTAVSTNVDFDGNPRIFGATADVGAYENQAPFQGAAHYVSLLSTNPVSPYTNWSTAATNLQDGVGSAQPGEYVIADDGVYTNSGTIMFGAETNRVVVTNGVTLTSAGGPVAAIISGAIQTRCAYVGSNSTLVGFTLANGRTRGSGDITNEQSGAGIWCEIGGTVSNCVVVGNSISGSNPRGGGIFRGSVYNSMIYSNNGALGAGAAFGNYFNCSFVSNAITFGNSGGGLYGGVASNCTFIANGIFYGLTGGGVYQSTLYHCTLATNYGTYGGGGADSSTLYDCTLIGNQSTFSGGGAHQCTNYSCTFLSNWGSTGGAVSGGICSGCLLSNNVAQNNGGGSSLATLTNCVLAFNRATNTTVSFYGLGGGAYQGTLLNCLLISNSAAFYGGGVYQANAYSCTIVGNTATNGGGTSGANVYNSIVYYNTAPTNSNYGSGGTLFRCFTTPLSFGTANCYTNEPLLVDLAGGDLHLQSNSLCINSGLNIFVTNPVTLTVDFAGNPRIVGTAVDVGAYEVQSPASVLPYIWLYQYGIPTDASADAGDADSDGMSNYAEWRALTNPTNALSVLALQTPAVTETNATITWQSVGGVQYYIQSTPDLFAPFQSIASNIVGAADTTSYTDTNAVGGVSLFYRVGVQ